MFRYRQVSKQIAASNDLGRDLWEALESRLKKQDERVLDMMGKVEVIQLRVLTQAPLTKSKNVTLEEETVFPSQESQKAMQQITSQATTLQSQVVTELRQAIENRIGKQDELIMNILDRLESIQSRLIEARNTSSQISATTLQSTRVRSSGSTEKVPENDLVALLSNGPLTSVGIREHFGISREHAARVLKGLFDRNLVVRNDSRKPFVYELTETGRRRLSTK